MKDLDILVNNINKWGGVISGPSEFDFAHTERSSVHVSVRKAAFLVSLLCMGISLLTFTACSEDDAPSIENNPDTETRINTPSTTAESTDSAGTMHGVINDWEEGVAGKLVPVDNPEEGNLNSVEGGAV